MSKKPLSPMIILNAGAKSLLLNVSDCMAEACSHVASLLWAVYITAVGWGGIVQLILT